MAGNAIRHGSYVEPTLVDSVDFWEEQEAELNQPKVILRGLYELEIMPDYFTRQIGLDGLFGI